MKRIAIFTALAADDPEMLARIAAFFQGMQELGWVVGRNLRIEYRFGAGDAGLISKYVAELVALSPDAVLAIAGALVGPLLSRPAPATRCPHFGLATGPSGFMYRLSETRDRAWRLLPGRARSRLQ
jgi:hypothetical protein